MGSHRSTHVNAIVREGCRILTLLFIHRQALVETLLTNAKKIIEAVPQGQSQIQQQQRAKETESLKIDGNDDSANESPEHLLCNGLTLLLPLDGDYTAYEQYLANSDTISINDEVRMGEREEQAGMARQRMAEQDRVESFCTWLMLNRHQVQFNSDSYSIYPDLNNLERHP